MQRNREEDIQALPEFGRCLLGSSKVHTRLPPLLDPSASYLVREPSPPISHACGGWGVLLS